MARNNETPIRVGLLGAGTVGSQTARLIVEQKDELSARIGRPVELTGVACLDPKETEKFPWIDQSIVTTDTLSVATNSDIVIELIGGTTVARKFVLAAIDPVLPWSPPTRRCWPSTARRSTPPPRPRASTSTSRPLWWRDSVPAPAARVLGRRQGDQHARHRQRHHQLHPRRDDHQGSPV